MAFDAIAYINEPRWQKVSLGLGRTRRLMELLGHPEERFASVHVAGTNGKGSTCAYLASICRAAGLRTGLFTSPYIERFEERIRINGADISPEELCACTQEVKRAAEAVKREQGEHPTEFELMFAVAALHFARNQCDLCIIEVGLGGRLDSTNVITPEVSVITRIGQDHMNILGSTLDEIACEKAGIIKPGIPCVTCEQPPAAMRVIECACEDKKCTLTVVSATDITHAQLIAGPLRSFEYRGQAFTTSLLGTYQPTNAALALACARTLRARGWDISDAALRKGIADARWPGRFEPLGRDPLFIIDGAHNADGSVALAASLDELAAIHAFKERIYLIGVLADKDVPAILAPHLSHAATCFCYAPDNPRALPADELCALARTMAPEIEAYPCDSAAQAVNQALKRAAPESLIIAFGSLYAIADIKSALQARA